MSPQLWLSASPHAHVLFQAATKQCHESGPGGRLILGGTLGLRRKKNDRSRATHREGAAAILGSSHLLGDNDIDGQEPPG